MATGTRSLPNDSPVPYFQSLERGYVSEGVPSNIVLRKDALHGGIQVPPQCANSDVFPYLPSSGIAYNPGVFEQDRLSTYTGLNDYDTLFEARHGRGAIDSVSKSDEGGNYCFFNGNAHYSFKCGYDRKSYDWGKTKTCP